MVIQSNCGHLVHAQFLTKAAFDVASLIHCFDAVLTTFIQKFALSGNAKQEKQHQLR